MLGKLDSVGKNYIAFSAKKTQKIQDNLEKPKIPFNIAIIDSFTTKTRDINGDGCPDLPHGEIVESLIKGNLKYSPEITKIDDKSNGGNPKEEDLLDAFKQVEANKNIGALNVSIACTSDISEIEDSYNKKFNKKEVINQETISSKRQQIVELMGGGINNVFADVINTIEKIANKRPVFIAAGNSMSNNLNILNLARGTFGVGSMAVNDLKSPDMSNYTKKSFFSGDNSTVNVFAKGEYQIKPIKKNDTVVGFDITEDGIMDIPISKITGSEVIKQFVGKDINKTLAPDEYYKNMKEIMLAKNWGAEANISEKEINEMSGKLYSLDKLLDNHIISIDTVNKNLRKGNYTDFNSAVNMDENAYKLDCKEKTSTPMLFFKSNNDEKVIYDPYIVVNSNDSAGTLKGTSYATPTALADHVNSLFLS